MPHPIRISLLLALACGATVCAAQMPARKLTKPLAKPLTKQLTPRPLPQTAPLRTVDSAKMLTEFTALKNAEKESPRSYIARPGEMNAALVKSKIATQFATFKRKPKLITSIMVTIKMPGIASVNGAKSGTFEPGNGYEIRGSGFGAQNGSVVLRYAGRNIALSVDHWSDGQILATMPNDGSVDGLSDADRVELDVGPAGKPVYKSNAYGFRAARADQTLSINDAMFSFDPAKINVAGASIPTAMGPTSKRFEDGYYKVRRETKDDLDGKHCINPGNDRISWANAGLRPGFEVTGYYWFHTTQVAGQSGRTTSTPRGDYSLTWEGDAVRVGYGAMRYYASPIFGFAGRGDCTSSYRVQLIVTGPRGQSPR